MGDTSATTDIGWQCMRCALSMCTDLSSSTSSNTKETSVLFHFNCSPITFTKQLSRSSMYLVTSINSCTKVLVRANGALIRINTVYGVTLTFGCDSTERLSAVFSVS